MKIINFELNIQIKEFFYIGIRKFARENKYRIHTHKWVKEKLVINKMLILPDEKKKIPDLIKSIFKTPK